MDSNIFSITVAEETFSIEVHPESELLSDTIRKTGGYSQNDLLTIREYLPRNGIFVDVGANIGWHTLYAAKYLSPKGHVYSFEPDSKNANLLRKNLILNQLENVTVVQSALSDKAGRQNLFRSKHNFGDHVLGLKNPDQVHSAVESVECQTFDSFIKNHRVDVAKISVIKMDVQGSEPVVLTGMQDFLAEHRPAIILEYSPRHIRALGHSVFEIFAVIDRYNYAPFQLRPKPGPRSEYLRPLDILDLMELTQTIEQTPAESFSDLLLIPQF